MLRYRRSMIGPFWLTISMGIMVFSLGLIYGDLFGMAVDRYLPFLTIGFLVWGLISAALNEGCQTFIESEGIIRQIDLPLSMFPLRVLWRNPVSYTHLDVYKRQAVDRAQNHERSARSYPVFCH